MKEEQNRPFTPLTDPNGLDKDFDYLTNSCSNCECTGLIPADLKRDGALESYQEVYAYQPPKIVKKEADQ